MASWRFVTVLYKNRNFFSLRKILMAIWLCVLDASQNK